jgi:hypothetical protein
LGLPEGGDGIGEFVLEDFDEFFAFRLTIGPALYKYMRIYLWTISSRCLTALRTKFFRRGLTLINTAFCFSHREKIKEIEPQIAQINTDFVNRK